MNVTNSRIHVVAAGSLLEISVSGLRLVDITLGEKGFPMPVGRVELLHLGPMDFEDSLVAVERLQLAEHLRSFSLAESIPDAPHRQYMDRLRQCWVVGGLPEAVSVYASTGAEEPRDFESIARIQQNMVATDRDDFAKYSHGRLRERVQLVFDRLPAMVGRKFKYSAVSRDHRAAELGDALKHLCMARVAWKVCRTAANGLPLGAEVYERHFQVPDHGRWHDVRGAQRRGGSRLNTVDLGKEDPLLPIGRHIVPVETKAGKDRYSAFAPPVHGREALRLRHPAQRRRAEPLAGRATAFPMARRFNTASCPCPVT